MVIEKYPEFFKAIEGLQYFMKKGTYYDAEVDVYNGNTGFEVHLGKTYWYKFSEWYIENTDEEPDQKIAYQNIVSLIERFVKNEVIFITCFANQKKIGTAKYNVEDSNELTKESVFADFQKNYPLLCEPGLNIILAWRSWEGNNYEDEFVS